MGFLHWHKSGRIIFLKLCGIFMILEKKEEYGQVVTVAEGLCFLLSFIEKDTG